MLWEIRTQRKVYKHKSASFSTCGIYQCKGLNQDNRTLNKSGCHFGDAIAKKAGYNEEPNDLYSSLIIVLVIISRRIRWGEGACSMYARWKRSTQGFGGET
jgi:hypothetical protein